MHLLLPKVPLWCSTRCDTRKWSPEGQGWFCLMDARTVSATSQRPRQAPPNYTSGLSTCAGSEARQTGPHILSHRENEAVTRPRSSSVGDGQGRAPKGFFLFFLFFHPRVLTSNHRTNTPLIWWKCPWVRRQDRGTIRASRRGETKGQRIKSQNSCEPTVLWCYLNEIQLNALSPASWLTLPNVFLLHH